VIAQECTALFTRAMCAAARLLAAREIEEWDNKLADLLHECAADVAVMQRDPDGCIRGKQSFFEKKDQKTFS
jgi:hypothetical protein